MADKRSNQLMAEAGSHRGSDRDQTNAPFKFLVVPTTTSAVGAEVGKLGAAFMDGVFRLIREHNLGSPITAVVLCPMVLDPEVATMPDRLSYKNKRTEVYATANIPFSVWVNADLDGRINLLADNLIGLLNKIPSKHLIDEDRALLSKAVEDVRRAIGTKSLH